MAISSVSSAATGLQNGGTIEPASQAGQLNMQDFFTLMAAQLEYQDPSSPTDTNQYMSEMAQFGVLEQITSACTKMNYGIASGLVGKKVEYTDFNDQTGESETNSGVVSAVDLSDSTDLKCQIGSTWESISNVTQIMPGSSDGTATA